MVRVSIRILNASKSIKNQERIENNFTFNIIKNNQGGIYFYSSSNNTFNRNNFSKNDDEITFNQDSTGNLFYLNNFISIDQVD